MTTPNEKRKLRDLPYLIAIGLMVEEKAAKDFLEQKGLLGEYEVYVVEHTEEILEWFHTAVRKAAKENRDGVVFCPKCGSKNVHVTQMHECLDGKPMKCGDCYHTWCT